MCVTICTSDIRCCFKYICYVNFAIRLYIPQFLHFLHIVNLLERGKNQLQFNHDDIFKFCSLAGNGSVPWACVVPPEVIYTRNAFRHLLTSLNVSFFVLIKSWSLLGYRCIVTLTYIRLNRPLQGLCLTIFDYRPAAVCSLDLICRPMLIEILHSHLGYDFHCV